MSTSGRSPVEVKRQRARGKGCVASNVALHLALLEMTTRH